MFIFCEEKEAIKFIHLLLQMRYFIGYFAFIAARDVFNKLLSNV
jgi:hypothetical protein